MAAIHAFHFSERDLDGPPPAWAHESAAALRAAANATATANADARARATTPRAATTAETTAAAADGGAGCTETTTTTTTGTERPASRGLEAAFGGYAIVVKAARDHPDAPRHL